VAKERQLIKVAPAPGRRVRDHRTMQVIPDGGIHVDPESDLTWFRRLRDGDLMELNEDGTPKTEDTLMERHGIKVPKPVPPSTAADAANEKAD
jgi:hypothetical protein